MTAFVDSSALVKRYVPESGADVVRALGAPWVVASITRVEAAAAIARKHRMGELSAADAATLTAAISFDVADPELFAVVRLNEPIVEQAVELVGRYGLRGYDAVQLASAVLARSVDETVVTFATFDIDLGSAAVAEGFDVLPV